MDKVGGSEANTEVAMFSSGTLNDTSPQYLGLQKLIKSLKRGNKIASNICLSLILQYDLKNEICQKALQNEGGVQIFCNLLETNDITCKIKSMKILQQICQNEQIHRVILSKGVLQNILNLLDSPADDLKALAADTLANMARSRKTRSAVRNYGGIAQLVKLLKCVPPSKQNVKMRERTPSSSSQIAKRKKATEVVRCAAQALWSCSVDPEIRQEIYVAGGINLLGGLFKCAHVDLLIPVVGTLQECASESEYRQTIQTEGLMMDFIKYLNSGNDELEMLCASIIFKCAEDNNTRNLVRRCHGLKYLASLLDKGHNKQLLAAALKAIWKCSYTMENLTYVQELLSVETLVGLLTNQPDQVLVSATGALAEFLKLPANKATIRKCQGIKPLISLLGKPNEELLVNVANAVGMCAEDKANIAIINQFHGVRQVWSLLKHPSKAVQISAAWALCPCLENAENLEDMRFVIGGIELIVDLLNSSNHEVQTSICAVVVKLAKDINNVKILCNYDIVRLLMKLAKTTDNNLRRHVADAIGQCSRLARNRVAFREVVALMVGYMKSDDCMVQEYAVKALFLLSKNARNNISMYKSGVVKLMIKFMTSNNEEIQDAAAGCVRNIRMLVQASRAPGLTKAQTSKLP